ncbi:MAG: HAMP domain-containing sensor histidine kinase [Elusimicrobiota bacterium]|jgi:signal transduction histidine kinase
MSIRIKLALVLSLAMLSATVAASLTFLSLQYASLREAETEKISLWKSNIANIVNESLLAKDPLMLLDYLQNLGRHYKEFMHLRVNRDGVWQEVEDAEGGKSRNMKLALIESVSVPLPPGSMGPPVQIEIWFSRAALAETQNAARERLARNMLTAGGSVALAGLLIGIPLGWTMTRRIVRIESVLHEIGSGKSDSRVTVSGKDEIGRLGLGVNNMAEKLQELDKLKKTFVASVTHELRSPLGAIESYVKTLLAEASHLTPEERENLNRVMSNVARLNHFVTNLLDMAKIERGKLDYSPRPVRIGELVEDAVLFFQPKAVDAKISIACLADKGIVIKADPDLVTHVLTNLISNALKFTRPGGSIRVDLKRTQDGVECSVSDTGVGIPPESLPRIFQAFERVKNPLRATGVGLGLVISRSIVDMHGGKMGVESKLGKGSRFFFSLPDNPPAAASQPQKA